MNVLLSIALVVQVAIIAAWSWQHVVITRLQRRGLVVPAGDPNGRADCPPLCVIVPARNESSRIQACLAAVLAQSHPALELLVVDDRSTDDTAAIVAEYARRDPRCRLLRIDELPPGWSGKSHALWIAAGRSTAPWLLFLDADATLLPHALTAAQRYALAHDLDLLSLWPRDDSRSFWEHVLIPLCGAQIAIWYGRQDDSRGPAFANGQFILFRRAAYFALGGHAAVREAIIEDIPLAARARACGLHGRAALGRDLVQVRMYDHFRAIVSGWSRIFRCVLSPLQMFGSLAWLAVGSAAPLVILPCAAASSSAWALPWVIAAGVHLAVLASVSVRFFGLARCRLVYLALYPLSIAGVGIILGLAVVQSMLRRPVRWRGTTYAAPRPQRRGLSAREDASPALDSAGHRRMR